MEADRGYAHEPCSRDARRSRTGRKRITRGTATAGAPVTTYELFRNSIFDGLDMLVSERAVPVPAGGATTRLYLTTITVPLAAPAGTYYLIAVADGDRSVLELSETNNTRYLQIVVR
jgi:hypothetical protein